MIYGPFTTVLIFQESGPVRDNIFRLMSLMMRSVPSDALQQVMPSSILLINKDFIKFSKISAHFREGSTTMTTTSWMTARLFDFDFGT